MPPSTVQSVRQYYEQNTCLFSFFGGSNQVRSIHRAIWLPGIQKLQQALFASNALVWQEIQELILVDPPGLLRLADLGCGIGGTLFYLLDRITLPTLAAGITISPVQAGLAQAHAKKEPNRFSPGFTVADFQSVPLTSKSFDVAYSIEAFVHAPHPARYLAETARLLRPGGRLILIDDVLSENVTPETEPHQLWLDAYRQGWRLPGLRTASWIAAEAASHGLIMVQDRSLTAWLKLRTIPNWAANFLLKNSLKMPLRHAIWGSLSGSLALQHCLKAGLVEFHLLVFERQA